MEYFFEAIRQNMVIVYFIYGVSFFLFGSVIIIFADPNSKFLIGRYLWLLGLFGILHAFNEWIDMLILIETGHWTPEVILFVGYFKNMIFAFTSFIFIFQFGGQMLIALAIKNKIIYWGIKGILWGSIVFLVLMMFLPLMGQNFLRPDPHHVELTDILIRYFIGFPGALLTGIAFILCQRECDISSTYSGFVNWSFIMMGILFILYAVLAGLVVPKAGFFPASLLNTQTFLNLIGLPVQVFRSICAVLSMIFIFGILRVSNIEKYRDEEALLK